VVIVEIGRFFLVFSLVLPSLTKFLDASLRRRDIVLIEADIRRDLGCKCFTERCCDWRRCYLMDRKNHLPDCKWGAACYRTNPEHLLEFRHPSETDRVKFHEESTPPQLPGILIFITFYDSLVTSNNTQFSIHLKWLESRRGTRRRIGQALVFVYW